MADSKYKIGDIVEINSGGPAMTVNTISSVSGKFRLGLVWYHNGKMETIYLFEDAVKPNTQQAPDITFI